VHWNRERWIANVALTVLPAPCCRPRSNQEAWRPSGTVGAVGRFGFGGDSNCHTKMLRRRQTCRACQFVPFRFSVRSSLPCPADRFVLGPRCMTASGLGSPHARPLMPEGKCRWPLRGRCCVRTFKLPVKTTADPNPDLVILSGAGVCDVLALRAVVTPIQLDATD
jgi:hypothetical protein